MTETPDLAHERDEADRAASTKLAAQGVIITDLHTAVTDYPELVGHHKEQDRLSLVSGRGPGSTFVYVPPGIDVALPIEARTRTSAQPAEPVERTLVIAGAGSTVQYIDGCSAPIYTSDDRRSSVVDIVVNSGANVLYTSIQNWSANVVDQVTQRARVEAGGHVEWINGVIGAHRTKQHLIVQLDGPGASCDVRSIAYAGAGQHQEVGSTIVHAAPQTRSSIVSKAIFKHDGRANYDGQVRVGRDIHDSLSQLQVDDLRLGAGSVRSPTPDAERGPQVSERADGVDDNQRQRTITEAQLFYLMSRGLTEAQATALIVDGFIEPVTRNLPVEYAVEWSRLIELQIEGFIG